MTSTPLRLHYSPLGWAQWLYGPFWVLVGLFMGFQFVGEVNHSIANSGVDVHSFSDAWHALFCHSLICRDNDLLFGLIAWPLFGLVALGLIAAGLALMSFDRESLISTDRFQTWRGRFVPWHKEIFTKTDITGWNIEKTPRIVVIGNRASTMGWFYRISATMNRPGKKPRTLFVAKCPDETSAAELRSKIIASFGK